MKILNIVMVGACLLSPTIAMAQSGPATPTSPAVSEPANQAPASAPQPAPAAQPSVTQASDTTTSGPLICKYYFVHGAAVAHRECMTAHQWERARNATQHAISDFQLRSLGQSPR